MADLFLACIPRQNLTQLKHVKAAKVKRGLRGSVGKEGLILAKMAATKNIDQRPRVIFEIRFLGFLCWAEVAVALVGHFQRRKPSSPSTQSPRENC